ncbi:MAG TPA: glutamyl-tRNA reductase [Actinomycetota bacterium]|nr:glutamyl-tRNA reductase [Actinomycetota bacterium]
MSIVVVGLNHRSASVSLLERLNIGGDRLAKGLHQLSTYDHVLEGVILSTCNRTEVYALVSKFHGGVQDLRNFLAEFCHVAPEDFGDHLYTYHDDAAVSHLFRVASGIDSMVIGESEILGQVRRAYQTALEEGLLARTLGAAFRQALRVGKRARTETAIGRNPVSISTAAVDLAKKGLETETLEDMSIAVIGAGKMGSLTGRALRDSGASDIVVVNRSEDRARAIAETLGASTRPLEDLSRVIERADIVISSTTAPDVVVTAELVTRAMAGRDRKLFIVDIAVPRDVDPDVAAIDNVVLRDIDDLRGVVESNLGNRLEETSNVEEIIAAELQRFVEWERATEIGPTISSLIARADGIREDELATLRSKVRDLDGNELTAIERAMERVVARLLHLPIQRARELATSKQAHLYHAALRELFELDDELEP